MDITDPYKAPSAACDYTPAPRAFVPAGKWRRFFNLIIDRITMLLAWAALVFVVAMLLGEETFAWLDQINAVQDYLLTALLAVFYFTPMETFGFSVGKLVTGTRVVDENGHPPGFRRVLLRSVCRAIPFDAFSVLFGDDREPRAWHDSLSGTWVVRR